MHDTTPEEQTAPAPQERDAGETPQPTAPAGAGRPVSPWLTPLLLAGVGLGIGLYHGWTVLDAAVQPYMQGYVLPGQGGTGDPGVPIPRTLDWLDAATALRNGAYSASRFGVALFVALLLAAIWRVGSRLQPSGDLIPVAASGRSSWLSGDVPLGRVMFCGLLAVLSLAVARAAHDVVSPVRGMPAPLGAYLLVLIVAPALLWPIWGDGGPLSGGEARAQRFAASMGRGLLVGVLLAPLFLAASGYGEFRIRVALLAAGLAAADWWWTGAAVAVLIPVAAGWALGALVDHLAPSRRPPGSWRRVAAAVALSAAALVVLGLFPLVIAPRLDLGRDVRQLFPNDGAQGYRVAAILAPDGPPPPSIVPDGSAQEVRVTPETVQRAWAHLERRKYRTALAYELFVFLHDSASLNWDTQASLRTDLRLLERAPSPNRTAATLLVEKLKTCPLDAESREVLDALADPRRFRWTDTRINGFMAAMYVRFGDMERARQFAAAAPDIPPEKVPVLLGASPLRDGQVSGRLRWLGQPAADWRVGIIPRAQALEIAGAKQGPFNWRFVVTSARTDAQGAFQLRHLSRDFYFLVVQPPAGMVLPPLNVGGNPGVISLSAENPRVQLAPIELTPGSRGPGPPPPRPLRSRAAPDTRCDSGSTAIGALTN